MAIGMPSMQDTELTVEDVLNLHQYWITKLYIEERRTTEQIVRLLKERRLIVTLEQIQQCIRNWKLVPPTALPESPTIPLVESLRDISSTIASKTSTTPPSNTLYTPSDSAVTGLYTRRPLPPLPSNRYTWNSKVRKQKSPTNDKLRLACHPESFLPDAHDIRTSSDCIPRGLSILEMPNNAGDGHEKIVVGLKKERARDLPAYRRAGDLERRPSGSRVHKGTDRRKRVAKEENTQPDRKGHNDGKDNPAHDISTG